MTRAVVLFLLLLPACAETQSQRAFTPRPAAAIDPVVTTPNKSIERDHELADALERSLHEQEDRDQAGRAPGITPQDKASRPDPRSVPPPLAAVR
jgi:hypothetical protein